jgi:hypothetical protein
MAGAKHLQNMKRRSPGRPKSPFNEIVDLSDEDLKQRLPRKVYETMYCAVSLLLNKFLRDKKSKSQFEAAKFVVGLMGDEKFMRVVKSIEDSIGNSSGVVEWGKPMPVADIPKPKKEKQDTEGE